MDPVSALGVVAAAVQFIEFSGGIVKTIIDVYRSVMSEGSINDLMFLNKQAETLRSYNLRL
jgi:hypothetical protein